MESIWSVLSGSQVLHFVRKPLDIALRAHTLLNENQSSGSVSVNPLWSALLQNPHNQNSFRIAS